MGPARRDPRGDALSLIGQAGLGAAFDVLDARAAGVDGADFPRAVDFVDDAARGCVLNIGFAARAAGPVSIDVPLANPDAVAAAEELGMTPSFETARMYRGPDPGLPVANIYGVTSLELG